MLFGSKKVVFRPFFGVKNEIFSEKNMKICKQNEHIFTQNRKNSRKFSEKAVFPAYGESVLKSVSIYSTNKYYIYKCEILPGEPLNTIYTTGKNYPTF
jgi:hypothetical protein